MLILIFGVHLLAVDLAMAGPLMAIWLEWRETRRDDLLAGEIGRQIAVGALAAATIGIGLGLLAVAALPLLEAAAYREAFANVPAWRWWSAAGEFAVYVLCIALYLLLWQRWRGHRWWHRGLALFAATDLMYHFPPLFTIISAQSMRPDWKDRPLDGALYRTLFAQGEVLSRVAHHWVAAVAVAAVVVMLLAIRSKRLAGRSAGEPKETAADNSKNGNGDSGAGKLIRQASRVALMATMAQLPIGVWVLLELPSAMQSQVMGEDLTATALFGLSVVGALGLMHQLAVVSLGEVGRRRVLRTAALMAGVVLLMAATLHRARLCAQEPVKISLVHHAPGASSKR